MTIPGTMEAVVARLLAATGPDRQLDVDIEIAVFNPLGAQFKQYVGMIWHSSDRGHVVKRYTESMDAALTLVPEGLDYELLHIHSDGPKRGEVKIHLKPYMESKSKDEAYGESHADAIAMCIAALRARSTPTPSEGE